jgi:hypothetical protein
MNDDASIPILNRILAVLNRSLPMYLADADPWTSAGDEQAAKVLARIVEDQRRDVNRLAERIIGKAAHVEPGHWPMEFTDLNFLSLDFLLLELLRHQKQDVAQIERCVALLARDRQARELAEEVLGSEKAHLDALEDLSRQSVA